MDLSDIATPEDSYYRDLADHRRLGPDPDRTKRFPRSYQYVAKGASRLDLGRQTVICRDLPEYKLPLLDLVRTQDLQRPRVDRRRQLHRLRGRWGSDAAEGRDLARSDVPFPSDDDHFGPPRRCPSLERQEAFRYETTAKRHGLRRGASTLSNASAAGEDATAVAELYRLGLLYDDEHLRGSGFGFAALAHEEPAYSLRPAKRARKLNKSRGYEPDKDAAAAYFRFGSQTLPLELSFAELARDDAIAQFLISPSPSETSDDDDDDARMHDFYHDAVDSMAIQHRLDELKSLARSVSLPAVDETKTVEDDQVPDLVHDNNNTQDSDYHSHDDYDTEENKTEAGSDEDQEWTVLARDDEAGLEGDAASGGSRAEAAAAGAWVVLGDDS